MDMDQFQRVCEKDLQEHFEHDDCPKCGRASVPAEGVPDQSLRVCLKCELDWFENLNEPVQKGKL